MAMTLFADGQTNVVSDNPCEAVILKGWSARDLIPLTIAIGIEN